MEIEKILLENKHVGKKVLYKQNKKSPEIEGTIASWDGRLVFVFFPICTRPHGVQPEFLRWSKNE